MQNLEKQDKEIHTKDSMTIPTLEWSDIWLAPKTAPEAFFLIF